MRMKSRAPDSRMHRGAWLRVMCIIAWAMLGNLAAAARAEAEFAPVRPGSALTFPLDHGAHPDFRTEWWYVTGWVTDESGVDRGFQVTFFRTRTGIAERSASRFAPTQLVLAHAAIADPSVGRLRHAERAERAYAPLAGAEQGATKAWIRDWVLAWDGDRYRTRIAAADIAFELEFRPQAPPVPNGVDGYSQKSPQPHHASYYYSRPQLAVSGTLRIGDSKRSVVGQAWLDHEWSSELMPERARGWDWIGINLHGGGSLMAFRMRDGGGQPMWTAITLIDGDTAIRRQGMDAVRFEPLRHWRSPRTAAVYPVEWAIVLPGASAAGGARRLRLVPLMDDQELDSSGSTGAIYWEGAVRVLEPDVTAPGNAGGGEREIGRGYLEMTGYANRPPM